MRRWGGGKRVNRWVSWERGLEGAQPRKTEETHARVPIGKSPRAPMPPPPASVSCPTLTTSTNSPNCEKWERTVSGGGRGQAQRQHFSPTNHQRVRPALSPLSHLRWCSKTAPLETASPAPRWTCPRPRTRARWWSAGGCPGVHQGVRLLQPCRGSGNRRQTAPALQVSKGMCFERREGGGVGVQTVAGSGEPIGFRQRARVWSARAWLSCVAVAHCFWFPYCVPRGTTPARPPLCARGIFAPVCEEAPSSHRGPPAPGEVALSPDTMAVATLQDVALVLRSVDGGDFLAHRCVCAVWWGRVSVIARGGERRRNIDRDARCAKKKKKKRVAASAGDRAGRATRTVPCARVLRVPSHQREKRLTVSTPHSTHTALASTAARSRRQLQRRPPPWPSARLAWTGA